MSPIVRKIIDTEFNLRDRVIVNQTTEGWVRMKLHTDTKMYRVQTDHELLPEMPAERLTLVERVGSEA